MRMLPRSSIAAGAAALLSVFVVGVPFGPVAHADDSDVQTQAAKEPVTVSIPVRTIDTPGRSGQSGIVEISVGRSAPMTVMLDTGSVGCACGADGPPASGCRRRASTPSSTGLVFPACSARPRCDWGA